MPGTRRRLKHVDCMDAETLIIVSFIFPPAVEEFEGRRRSLQLIAVISALCD